MVSLYDGVVRSRVFLVCPGRLAEDGTAVANVSFCAGHAVRVSGSELCLISEPNEEHQAG